MVRLATKLAWARSCPDPGTRILINHEMLQEEKAAAVTVYAATPAVRGVTNTYYCFGP